MSKRLPYSDFKNAHVNIKLKLLTCKSMLKLTLSVISRLNKICKECIKNISSERWKVLLYAAKIHLWGCLMKKCEINKSNWSKTQQPYKPTTTLVDKTN